MTDHNDIKSIQIIDNYFPVIDGVVETVHNYALNMNSVVLCPKMVRRYNTKNLPYEVITSSTIHVPFSQYAVAVPALDPILIEKLDEIRPDIIHVHSPATLGQFALEMGQRYQIPVVASFHSKIYDAVLEYTKNKEIAKIVTNRTVKFYESCDEVWACSEGTAQTLHDYGFKGDIRVMTNGTSMITPDNLNQLKVEVKEKYNLPENKHILLFVGQMVWYKNIRLILDAFRLLCNEREDYCLVLVGTGKDVRSIKNYIAKLNFKENQVIITGKISNRTYLSGIYMVSDLFFFPSTYDNTPLVVREAAALGLPSLVTEGSNAAEPIEKDVNGFLAAENAESMYEELKKIFDNPKLLRSAGEKAKETIPILWSSLIPEVEKRYREIINKYGEHK